MEYGLAGLVGGFCEYLLGHPLDTVKVKMQVHKYPSIRAAGSNIYKQHGVFGFFRGLPPSLASAMVRNGVLFGTYGNVYDALPYNGTIGAAVAGGISGMISTIVFQPTDLLKIRLQTTKSGNTFQVINNIVQKEGIAGFLKGTKYTLLRESVGCSLYYGVYQYMKDTLPYHNKSYENFTYGAITGWISFMATHPIDVVKTRIQAHGECPSVIWKDLRADGVRGLWRGWLPMSMRVIPCSAIMFMTYEKTLNYFV